MSRNLADYFAKNTKTDQVNANSNDNDDEDMGPSVSMAVEAENDEDFKRSTFSLKRTRSMGVLDGYADPSKKLLAGDDDADEEEEDYDGSRQYNSHSTSVSPPSADNDNFLLPQDDNDVVREPERHVDYLSHEWKESEIQNSWKYIILKKKKRDVDLINAARLENASWRTWAKARNHLKTVSPEIVNWSKDSDVTWLYGPIVNNDNDSITSGNDKNADMVRGYGSDDENSMRMTPKVHHHKNKIAPPKPILKKRTVTEIIEENAQWKLNEARKHINEIKHAAVVMDPSSGKDLHDDYDALAARVNAQYYSSRPNTTGSYSENSSFVPNQTVATSYSSSNDIINSKQPNMKTLTPDQDLINQDTNASAINNGIPPELHVSTTEQKPSKRYPDSLASSSDQDDTSTHLSSILASPAKLS